MRKAEVFSALSIFLLAAGLASPAASQSDTACPQPTGRPTPPITFRYESGEGFIDRFSAQLLAYLNTTGSAENLQRTLTDISTSLSAQVIGGDVDGDGADDLLVNVSVDLGPFYSNVLSVFGCARGRYQQLASREIGDVLDSGPTQIVAVTDMNGDGRAEIVSREVTITQKYLETVRIYGWDGAALSQVFDSGFSLGFFQDVRVENADNDPAARELLIDDAWGYGQAVATAAIEISHVRPIREIIGWNGDTYVLTCQHFTDDPPSLLETLHSAETYRACGDLIAARTYYQRMIDDPALLSWGVAFGIDSDPDAYMNRVERAYLTAFAHYRLVQIDLAQGDLEAAQAISDEAQAAFPPGEFGHVYAAMTAALVEDFQSTSSLDSACEAAQSAFEISRSEDSDPGIDPVEARLDPDIGWNFYYYGGFEYSSPPDNIFAVPEDVADLIQIPVCLH